jgi:hypothetical protein
LQALRTPEIAFSRVNGSVAPERFSTVSCICSIVVKRLPQPLLSSGQVRRRRIDVPSSATRESRTRVSVLRQYGQCILRLLPGRDGHAKHALSTGRVAVDIWASTVYNQ